MHYKICDVPHLQNKDLCSIGKMGFNKFYQNIERSNNDFYDLKQTVNENISTQVEPVS